MVKTICKEDISDVMIERPISFRFGLSRYMMYPLSLGKMQLCSRIIESIGLDRINGGTAVHVAVLSTVLKEREKCLRLLSYVSLPGRDCLDETKVRRQIRRFSRIKDTDIASILVLFLSMDKTKAIMKEFGIDMEEKRLAKAVKAKNREDSNSISFGGKSIWGTIIDTACERYGWTYQYVVWGISYSALQLMMSDHIKTVIMTDKERKSAGITTDGNVIDAGNTTALREYIKSQNWK